MEHFRGWKENMQLDVAREGYAWGLVQAIELGMMLGVLGGLVGYGVLLISFTL
jgi:hypothetical protein